MTTINQTLKKATKKLTKISSTPQLDAEILLAYILKKTREYIITYSEHPLTRKQEKAYTEILQRRLNYEPIAYILGQKDFYGLNFKVNEATLIPRPETEHLVDATISNLSTNNSSAPSAKSVSKKTIITDIGTGSGNIIISLAKKIEAENLLHTSCYMLYGIDISQKALTIAKYNAKKNNVGNKIKFLKGNLLQPIIENFKFKVENLIIIANLPYLSKKIYFSTMPDVKKFEPQTALLSGIDGLDHYEKLLQQLKQIPLRGKNCSLIIEISPEQKNKIAKLISKYFPRAKIEFKKDLAKKWRIVIIKF